MIGSDPIERALISETQKAWDAALEWLRGNIPPGKRMALAATAVRACEPSDRWEIMDILKNGSAPPLPFRQTLEADAEEWAALSDKTTLKTYAAAIWLAMNDDDRKRFDAWAKKKGAEVK